jgi:hypothetical protein
MFNGSTKDLPQTPGFCGGLSCEHNVFIGHGSLRYGLSVIGYLSETSDGFCHGLKSNNE